MNIMCVDTLSLCQVVNLVNDRLHWRCYWLYMDNYISIPLCKCGTDLLSGFAFNLVTQFMNLLKRECPRSCNNDISKKLVPSTPYPHTSQFSNLVDLFDACLNAR